MNWAVGITSCAGRTKYLPATVESIKAAGWPAIESCYVDNGTLGPWGCFQRVLRTLLDRPTPPKTAPLPPADAVLLCQDDIALTRSLRPWLERQLAAASWWPTCGFVSLYVSQAAAEAFPGHGWRIIDRAKVRRHGAGACALVFSPDSARLLLADPPHPAFFNLTDLWVRKWAWAADRPMVEHLPSLCRHVGRETAIIKVPGEIGPRDEFGGWNEARHEGEFVEDAAILTA